MNRTSRPVRRTHNQGPIWLLALLVAVGLAIGLAAYQERGHSPKHQGGVSPEGPAVYVPSPTPAPKPLSLALDLPALDPDQAYWFHTAQIVARCPLCRGLDQPAIVLPDQAITVWLGLIWTESAFHPWATSSIGCGGLGQLCGALQTPDTDADPVLNLYVSLKEYARLLAGNGGDLSTTLENYKGSTTDDTKWQASLVWSVVRVGS